MKNKNKRVGSHPKTLLDVPSLLLFSSQHPLTLPKMWSSTKPIEKSVLRSTAKALAPLEHRNPPPTGISVPVSAMQFSSDSSLIQVTVDEHGIAILKINRPEKRNALSQKLIDSLVSAIAMIERDSKIRVAILTGSRTAGPFSGQYGNSGYPILGR